MRTIMTQNDPTGALRTEELDAVAGGMDRTKIDLGFIRIWYYQTWGDPDPFVASGRGLNTSVTG